MKLKDYKIIRCPNCNCECYDVEAQKEHTVGNPVFTCPKCGESSLRKMVLEAGLMEGKRCFAQKFSYIYFAARMLLCFIYVVFVVAILIERELMFSIYFVAIALVLYAFYEIIRAVHRKTYLSSDEYRAELERSLDRLDDDTYAAMIMQVQKPDRFCPYLTARAEKNDQKTEGKE